MNVKWFIQTLYPFSVNALVAVTLLIASTCGLGELN